MRRAVLLVVVAAAVMVLAGGVLLAASENCAGAECVGTRGPDAPLVGTSTPDQIAVLEGNDEIHGEGGDQIYGDEGNDTIDVWEISGSNGADTVNCGPGEKDEVFFNQDIDEVSKNCEIRRPR